MATTLTYHIGAGRITGTADGKLINSSVCLSSGALKGLPAGQYQFDAPKTNSPLKLSAVLTAAGTRAQTVDFAASPAGNALAECTIDFIQSSARNAVAGASLATPVIGGSGSLMQALAGSGGGTLTIEP